MKRPIAAFGLYYFIFQIIAIFVTKYVLIGICVALLIISIIFFVIKIELKGTASVATLACFAVLIIFTFYTNYVINPLLGLSGQTGNFTATVYKVSAGYNSDNMNAHIIVEHKQGTNTKIKKTFNARALLPGVNIGDVLYFNGTINKIEDVDKAYNYPDKIFLEISDVENVEYIGKTQSLWYKAHVLQKELTQNIFKYVPNEIAGVISTMALGSSELLNDDIKQDFTNAGMSHVLVVSGMHIGIVATLAFSLCNVFTKSRIAAIFALLAALMFTMVTGFTASSLRALLLITLFYSARLICRKSDVFTSLGITAFLICAQNPYACVDLGTLLSFSATVGVLLASTHIRFKRLLKQQENFTSEYSLFTADSLLVPIGATVATLPVLVSFGIGVSIFSVLANVIAAPIVPFVTVGGMVFSVLSNIPLLKPIGLLFGLFASVNARVLVAIAAFFGNIPGAVVYITGISAVICIVGAITLCFVAYKNKFKQSKMFACTALFILLCGMLYFYIDKNVVKIVRAGSNSETAVVIMHNFSTAAVFSGRSTNIAHVKNVLEQYNRTNVDVVVDLRKSFDEDEIKKELFAKEYISANNLVNSVTINAFDDVYIDVCHQQNGNYANILINGFSAGISYGDVDMAAYDECDVFIAGAGEAQNLECNEIWLPQDTPDWLLNYEGNAKLIYDIDTLMVETKTDNIKWGAKRIDYK